MLACAIGVGCSVGRGEGTVLGTVTARDCGLRGKSFDLDPTFFAAEPIEDTLLEIRVQHGSDLASRSDGLRILVTDATKVRREHLGVGIPVSNTMDALVTMSLYLNETCPVDRDDPPANFISVSGTITFASIYAPKVSEDDVEIAATFSDVRVVDTSRTEERFAIIEGAFLFFFSRGRPAQRFP